MNSLQVFGFLLVVGLSQSAPQQDVISQVLAQLTPVISQTVGSVLGRRQGSISAGRTTNFGQGASGVVGATSFGQGANSVTRNTNNLRQGVGQRTSFGQGVSGGVRTNNFAGRGSTTSSGATASQLTSNVVTSLQPSIAAAVAQALRGSQSRPAVSSNSGRGALTLTPEEEAKINAQQVNIIYLEHF